jgi:hypothetical protein
MITNEDQLTKWAQGPGATEQKQCEDTISMIARILRPRYGTTVSILPQGSFHNRTNIAGESDVDIAVRNDGAAFHDLHAMPETARSAFLAKLSDLPYTFQDFKTEVHQLLTAALGSARVERRNKCIFVRETAVRIDADVVPCYCLNRVNASGTVIAQGIQFLTDRGQLVNSFPDQHYQNGVTRNDESRRMFKRTVRILKHIAADITTRNPSATVIASFFIECLTYNVPASVLIHSTYTAAVRGALYHLWNGIEQGQASSFVEVNELKWLFSDGRTVEQAKDFILQAWSYVAD